MHDQYIDIDFVGFEPSDNYKKMSNNVSRKLYLQAPSYSKVCLKTTKTESGYECHCKILPKIELFNEKASAKTAENALTKVHAKIKKKIRHWRSIRPQTQPGGAA